MSQEQVTQEQVDESVAQARKAFDDIGQPQARAMRCLLLPIRKLFSFLDNMK